MCEHEFIVQEKGAHEGPAQQTVECNKCGNIVFLVLEHECNWESVKFKHYKQDGTQYTPEDDGTTNDWICRASHQYRYGIPKDVDLNKIGEKCVTDQDSFDFPIKEPK